MILAMDGVGRRLVSWIESVLDWFYSKEWQIYVLDREIVSWLLS